MRQNDSGSNGQHKRLTGPGMSQASSRLPAVMLMAGLTFGAFPQQVRAIPPAIQIEEARIILETNATDCDTGLQVFFDAEAWREVTVTKPDGETILLRAEAPGPGDFGPTEYFNEFSEPVMAELAAAVPPQQCAKPESTLAELFAFAPAGTYQFDGETVDGQALEGEATLSHIIPAPAVIVGPPDDEAQDPNNTVIEWEKVEEPIDAFPIVPGLGPVIIVGFHVVVERENPEPLVVFTADLPADATQVTVPPEFLEAGADYKFEILQIDWSGNQTIVESEFTTAGP